MSDFKNVMKGGWHPKGKDGGKESWRGDFKGINQVAGWMGKGKKPGEGERSEHMSRPLASLKDPSSFGAPPKNVNYHGGAALPNEITPHTGGLGAPLSQAQIDSANRAAQGPPLEEVEEQQKRAGPPLPYRADRTGLQTSHLPPPPVHRDIASVSSPEPAQLANPKPGLPPRLPARQASADVVSPASPPPPSYDTAVTPSTTASTNGGLNTSAMNRLGNAGISVPGLGIGKANDTNSNPWKSERSQNTTSPPQSAAAATNTFSELQSRFSRMNSTTSNTSTTSQGPAPTPPLVTAPTSPQPSSQNPTPTPPTWQQSQSALRTATNFHQNPSSVSAADAQSAATTAHSAARSASAFREKHADTIAAAGNRANAFNQKYKVQSRFEKFLDKHAPLDENPQQQTQQQGSQINQQQQQYQQPQQSFPQQPFPPVQSPVQKSPSPELAASISRKPPPPPPPKKPVGMHGNATGAGVAAPPPVPMGTKPGYS